MLSKAETIRNDRVKIVELAGAATGEDVEALRAAVYAPFAESWGPLILQAEGLVELAPECMAELSTLAETLEAQGADLVVVSTQAALFPGLKVVENRHLALGDMVSRLSVKDDLLAWIEKAQSISLVPLASEAPEEDLITYFRDLQFLLLFTYPEGTNQVLEPGARIKVTLHLDPDAEATDAAFEAEVARFAYLQDGQLPCVVLHVPSAIERIERSASLSGMAIDLQCTYSDPQAMRATPRYGKIQALSTTSCTFTCRAIEQREGQVIALDIDFRTFRLQTPLKAEIQRLDYHQDGMLVTVEFGRMSAYDESRIADFLESL